MIVTYGRIAAEALEAAKILREEGVPLHLLALERLKPYRETALRLLPLLGGPETPVVFLEEGIRAGGAGMLLRDALTDIEGSGARPFKILAVDESFGIQKKAEPIFKTWRFPATISLPPREGFCPGLICPLHFKRLRFSPSPVRRFSAARRGFLALYAFIQLNINNKNEKVS